MVLLLVMAVAVGCRGPGGATTWVRGSSEQRWVAMERHLRGLDVAMIEVGHRYDELYWAGSDGNWDYAAYQTLKIRLALDNALERRPKRRETTERIFLPTLGQIESTIAARDKAAFAVAFQSMTSACNACHAAEHIATFRVVPPQERNTATTRLH